VSPILIIHSIGMDLKVGETNHTASSQSQYCLIKKFPDTSRVFMFFLNVSGILDYPKRAIKPAKGVRTRRPNAPGIYILCFESRHIAPEP
jgi:hypothetical protein